MGFLDPKPLTPGALDAATAALAGNPASALAGELSATFVPKWKATTAYLAGDKVLSPSGDVVSAKVDFTSGGSYSSANWDLSATVTGKLDTAAAATTYVKFVDLAGNPISARHVTIKVDTSTWEINDIIAEA